MNAAAAFACDALGFGWRVIPVSDNKIPLIKEWTTRELTKRDLEHYTRFSHVCGRQIDGSFIIGPEFDHRPAEAIDAQANYALFRSRISDTLFSKLWITWSTSGTGIHIRATVPREISGSIVRDDKGRKIGDLRSTGGHLLFQDESKWISGAPWTMRDLTDAELDEFLRALNYRTPLVLGGDKSPAWPAEAAYWTEHIADLIEDGIPARWQPTSQGAHYITHQVPAQRTSDIRYAMIEELIRSEYDDAQTAALALHLADFGASQRKGLAWLQTDIARIISKVRTNGPRVHRSNGRFLQSELDIGACTGRPRKQTIEEVKLMLDKLRCGDRVPCTQAELAAELGVSVRTVQRIEKELAALGIATRQLTSDRHVSYLVLTGDAKTSDTQDDLDIPDAAQGVLGDRGVGEGGPVSPPKTPEYLLAHLVEDAVNELQHVRSPKTRAAVVLAYVQAYRPDADAETVAWYLDHEWRWQKQRRADERFVAKLRMLKDSALSAKEKSYTTKSREAHDAGNPGLAWVWGRLSWFVAREWERREPLRKCLREPEHAAPRFWDAGGA